jgi:hypothetical protein
MFRCRLGGATSREISSTVWIDDNISLLTVSTKKIGLLAFAVAGAVFAKVAVLPRRSLLEAPWRSHGKIRVFI